MIQGCHDLGMLSVLVITEISRSTFRANHKCMAGMI